VQRCLSFGLDSPRYPLCLASIRRSGWVADALHPNNPPLCLENYTQVGRGVNQRDAHVLVSLGGVGTGTKTGLLVRPKKAEALSLCCGLGVPRPAPGLLNPRDHPGVLPQVLKLIISSHLGAEQMDHHAVVVHQYPAGVWRPFFVSANK